jgi:hypothetical protein
MPVMECQLDGKPGFKWGEEGKCYSYTRGDESSKERARKKAIEQGRAIEANQTHEFRGMFTDVLVVTELRGSYPNVPISADVDYSALIAGDDDPQFLTLPIGMVNAKSGNGRYYDEEFVIELMRQTLELRPIGLMGHLSESERATAFPKESLHWVGAVRDGDMIWGKAYLIGEARERVRRYKASGKSIATSIDAYAEGQWDESIKAHRMKASTLRLNQIDLAPSDRAGISALARVPMLTTEMQDDSTLQESTKMPDKLEIIQELKREDARLLPDEVRAAILETVTIPPEVAQVQELRTALGVDDKADLAKLITEMRQVQETQAKAAIKARITELATDKEKGIKQDAIRGIVVEMVNSRNPKNIEEADAAYQEVSTSQPIMELLKANLQTTMGPNQTTRVQPQQGAAKYFPIPQEA